MRNFDYHRPRSLGGVVQAAAGRNARLKAGGTDLLPMMKLHIDRPEAVVELGRAGELHGIRRSPGGWWLGATTTLAELVEDEALPEAAPAVHEAAARTATPLVRSKATLGGNLCQRPRCWYFRNEDYPCAKKGGDTCYAMDGENKYHAIFENVTCNIVHPSNLAPALWVHDGVVHVQGPEERRDVSLGAFFVLPELDMSTEVALDPGEVVTGVSFTPLNEGSGSAYVEVREKQSYDWALVSAACRADLEDGKVGDLRIVVSAVAPVPLRREGAEELLRGREPTEELAWKAGAAAVEGATPLRDNKYKVRMLKACVAHAVQEACRRAQAG